MGVVEYKYEKSEELGGTLHIKGEVHYQGGRDVLNAKLRARDDEIDRLRALIGKYLKHIENQEGTLFLGSSAKGIFTDEEIEELNRYSPVV